ncbi:MAG: SulP family inorganic anion transporter [Rhizobium sp.]|nr:SulP family inorganic anion transporter [Rhizobium sp.]MDM8013672.1 SulP family inorganic anion transporter [Rhizobium sp.]
MRPHMERLTGLIAPLLFAVIAGIDGLGTSIAFAALIFTGSVSAGFGMGVGAILMSSVLLTLVIALGSRYPTSIGQVRKPNVAILAAAIAAALASPTLMDAPEDVRIMTAFAVLGASAVATGLVFVLSGAFGFGKLVRFMPFSVIAGFLAGSGCLMIQGAVNMLVAGYPVIDLFTTVDGRQAIANLHIALIFAFILNFALRRSSSPLVAPGIMLAAAVLFYLMLIGLGVDAETARSFHWLPALPAEAGLELPSPIAIFTHADWSAVIHAAPAIASVVLLSMVGLLLNTSGQEVATRREIDADSELRTTGLANLLVGGFGGAPGFSSMSMTLLATRMGGVSRLPGLATTLVLVLMLPFAGQLAGAMPTFVAAGLMITLGYDMAEEWLWGARRQLPRNEWLVILTIPFCMLVFGFLTGMMIGLALAILSFVYNYARLSVIRSDTSLHARRSSTDRPPVETTHLEAVGYQVQVLELQEYLFFGTAEQVVAAVRRRLQDQHRPTLRHAIVDFRRVSGMDAAAAAAFVKIRNLLAEAGAELLLSGLSSESQATLRRNGLGEPHGPALRLEPDLDHAIEYCEQNLLQDIAREETWQDIEDYFVQTIGPSARLKDLVASMEEIRLQPGDRFIRAGEPGEDLFLLWTGRAKVEAVLANGKRLRLRTVKPGVVLGEIAIYRGGARTADVVAEVPSTVYRLARRQLRYLEQADPELALLVHRLCATTLAERLTIANRVVQSLHE